MQLVESLFRTGLVSALTKSERSAEAPALYAEFLKLESSPAETDALKRARLAGGLFKLAAQASPARERLNEAFAIMALFGLKVVRWSFRGVMLREGSHEGAGFPDTCRADG